MLKCGQHFLRNSISGFEVIVAIFQVSLDVIAYLYFMGGIEFFIEEGV